MTDNYIQLNKDNVLRLKIQDSNGIDTGEMLEFDLEDTELLLRYQDMLEQDKKLRSKLRNELYLIKKREDVKGKKYLSKNEEDALKTINNFFKEEVKVMNMFLGENGVEKLLNGRKFGWTTLQEISEIITKQIGPHLDKTMDIVTEKIKSVYGTPLEKNDDIEVIE